MARTRVLSPLLPFLPITLLDFVLFVLPMIIMAIVSVLVIKEFHVTRQLTAENYLFFLTNPLYLKVLGKSVLMALATTVICIALSFPFAAFLVSLPRAIQRMMLVLVILPFWTSYLLRVYSWLNILGEQGAINRFLQWTGITDHSLSLFLYDRPAVILVLAYLYFPFAALTLYASLERFDWEQFKAAMDLGASPLVAIRKIMLPQIKPGITTAVIFVFIPILGEYLTPQLVGGARGVMIGNLIVNFFSGAQYTRGAAAALLVAALIVALLIVCRRSLEVQETYAP
jgi:spermidine/putrescine transport system permease protein